MDGVKLQKVPNIIDLNSSHLKDTFGHVSTPAFSLYRLYLTQKRKKKITWPVEIFYGNLWIS